MADFASEIRGLAMLDVSWVVQNLDEVAKGLKRRGPGVDLSGLEKLANARRALITETETTRARQKAESPKLGKLLKEDPAAAERLRAELKELGDKAKAGDVEITRLDAEIEAQLL